MCSRSLIGNRPAIVNFTQYDTQLHSMSMCVCAPHAALMASFISQMNSSQTERKYFSLRPFSFSLRPFSFSSRERGRAYTNAVHTWPTRGSQSCDFKCQKRPRVFGNERAWMAGFARCGPRVVGWSANGFARFIYWAPVDLWIDIVGLRARELPRGWVSRALFAKG